MSSSSITDPGVLLEALDSGSLPAGVVGPIKRIAFWTAVVLPFLYLPLLASGLESISMAVVFLALVTVNVCALIVGHPYKNES